MIETDITPIAVDVKRESLETKKKIVKLMADNFGLESTLSRYCLDHAERLGNICQTGDLGRRIMWGTGPLSIAQSEKLKEGEHLTAKEFLDKYDKKYVKWDDLVTITINAYEVVKLLPTSGSQPSSGLDDTIYDFVNKKFDKNIYDMEWYHNITSDKIRDLANDPEGKQRFVDHIFNPDEAEQREKEEREKQEYYSKIEKLELELKQLKEENPYE